MQSPVKGAESVRCALVKGAECVMMCTSKGCRVC